MKALLLSLILFSTTVLYAQEDKDSFRKNMSFGFQFGLYGTEIGPGLHITSPYFINRIFAVRLRGNALYIEKTFAYAQESTIDIYPNLSLGLVAMLGNVSDNIRVYCEGGVMRTKPPYLLSSSKKEKGGYGLFGLELFFSQRFNFFLETGGVGSGGELDKLHGNPSFSTGLLFQMGLRCQF